MQARFLDNLSTEVLLHIFKYLKPEDLCKLKQTCRRFNELIIYWDHYVLGDIRPLVTNLHNDDFRKESYYSDISLLEKIRISMNWKDGRFVSKRFLSSKAKSMPWLHLNKKFLYISRGNKIMCYKRNNDGVNFKKKHFELSTGSRADISKFAIKNGNIIAGKIDGNMTLWTNDGDKKQADLKFCHDCQIQSVDISKCGQTMISGSRCGWFKVWSKKNSHEICLNHEISCSDRVWSVSLNDYSSYAALGTAGIVNTYSITVYDLERISEVCKFRANGVFYMEWENPFTLWSCGFDARLRRWDLRVGLPVQTYKDPYESPFYCFKHDGSNTVLAGSQSDGRVTLFDTRHMKTVQVYFTNTLGRDKKNSPVYSLVFDAKCLYTATDQCLNYLDFSIKEPVPAYDYSDTFNSFEFPPEHIYQNLL